MQKHIIENKISSRDKLKGILKAHAKGDNERIREIIGMNLTRKLNFSILRISSIQGNIQYQESGIQQLSISEKHELKNIYQNGCKESSKSSRP